MLGRMAFVTLELGAHDVLAFHGAVAFSLRDLGQPTLAADSRHA